MLAQGRRKMELEKDLLKTIWSLQAKQQRDLGLDPRYMNEVDKRSASSDYILSLYEEVSELQRVISNYKKHILVNNEVDLGNAAEEIADIIKLTVSVAQLYGIAPEQLVDAVERKTNVISARAEGQRTTLQSDTKLLCVDMDHVICDLTPFEKEQNLIKGNAPMNAHTMRMMEAWKTNWFKTGRFLELSPVEGASEALKVIRSWGWKIVVITARPQWQHKRIYADTLEWLQRYEMEHDLILFNKDKVEAIYEYITPAWPIAFVEDHERNARQLSAAGVRVLLFDVEHNRSMEHIDSVQRVAGWTEVLYTLEGMMQ